MLRTGHYTGVSEKRCQRSKDILVVDAWERDAKHTYVVQGPPKGLTCEAEKQQLWWWTRRREGRGGEESGIIKANWPSRETPGCKHYTQK